MEGVAREQKDTCPDDVAASAPRHALCRALTREAPRRESSLAPRPLAPRLAHLVVLGAIEDDEVPRVVAVAWNFQELAVRDRDLVHHVAVHVPHEELLLFAEARVVEPSEVRFGLAARDDESGHRDSLSVRHLLVRLLHEALQRQLHVHRFAKVLLRRGGLRVDHTRAQVSVQRAHDDDALLRNLAALHDVVRALHVLHLLARLLLLHLRRLNRLAAVRLVPHPDEQVVETPLQRIREHLVCLGNLRELLRWVDDELCRRVALLRIRLHVLVRVELPREPVVRLLDHVRRGLRCVAVGRRRGMGGANVCGCECESE